MDMRFIYVTMHRNYLTGHQEAEIIDENSSLSGATVILKFPIFGFHGI